MLFGTPKNPKGPQGSWEHIFIQLSGTSLTFKLPKTNLIATHGQMAPVSDKNLYDESKYCTHEKAHLWRTPPDLSLCRRYWEFDGLRFSTRMGGYGHLELDVRIDKFPEFSSLFRPCRRECAIERFIYSSRLFAREPKFNRLSYQVQKNGEHVWSCYEVENRRYNCSLPITDEHLLTFDFQIDIYQPKTQIAKAAKELAYKIMSTVKVGLSEDAKRCKHEAESQYPWEKLQESLPPYDFEHLEEKSRHDLINDVSAANNHDIDIPFEVISQQADDMASAQTKRLNAIRDRVLASHLRFTELEKEEAKNAKRG